MEFGESNEGRVLSNVLELLKCSVCFDFMYSSIYQCPNGHTLCSRCKEIAVDECPNCREELGHIRCLALEKMAESLEVHCKYEEYGCCKISPYHAMHVHEESCELRPYRCPDGGECSVMGDIPLLVWHLTTYHETKMINLPEFDLRFSIASFFKGQRAPWTVRVFHCFGEFFCLHGVSDTINSVPVYMAYISFMGNNGEACNFCYKLEVESDGRKFSFEGIPTSVRQSIMESGNGLIWMRNMTPLLGGKRSWVLQVRGRIWKK